MTKTKRLSAADIAESQAFEEWRQYGLGIEPDNVEDAIERMVTAAFQAGVEYGKSTKKRKRMHDDDTCERGKGEWFYDEGSDQVFVTHDGGKTYDGIVCDIRGYSSHPMQMSANARLIAQAPRLAELLDELAAAMVYKYEPQSMYAALCKVEDIVTRAAALKAERGKG